MFGVREVAAERVCGEDESMTCTLGVTTHLEHDDYAKARRTYARVIARSGGIAVYLPPPDSDQDAYAAADAYLDLVDGIVLTGGDDPIMEAFGQQTDPRITPVHPDRQRFELALLERAHVRDIPTLGVCLGMQYMALKAGGRFEQWLPDSIGDDAARAHWNDQAHTIQCTAHDGLGSVLGGKNSTGVVRSHHRQAVLDAGGLRTVARSDDGVVEAIDDPAMRFWAGVQWHPERTPEQGSDTRMSTGIFEALINACKKEQRA